MAKRNLANEQDTKAVNSALEGNSRGFIKLDKKTYIRLLSKEYVSEFVHYLNKKAVVCLGDYDKDKGYAPTKCPICAKVEKFWEKFNTAKAKNSTKGKAEMGEVLKKVNQIASKPQTLLIAVKGNIRVEEDEDGNLKSFVEWEKEAKILQVSKAQWFKLRNKVFEDYEYMQTVDDLINRNFIFQKEEKSGKEGNQYTEVEIIPSKKKTKPPKVENEFPDIEASFNYLSKKEIIKLMSETTEEGVEDEDLEEELEEETVKTSKKFEKKQNKKLSKPKKKVEEGFDEDEEEDDEPDFVKDDFEDEDDDDYDDFEDDEDDEEEDEPDF